MASFECKLIPIDKLIVEPRGVKEPLCNDCVQPDCDNPIRKHSLSIMGKPVSWRLWVVNNQVRQVVQCVGYVSGEAENDSMGSYIAETGTTIERAEGDGRKADSS